MRFILLAFCAFFATHVVANEPFNTFAERMCAAHTGEYQCVDIADGDTWEGKFPGFSDADRNNLQLFNRQNVELQSGQKVVVPAQLTDWWALSPLPLTRTDGYTGLHIDLTRMAGADYVNGELQMWFPAIGGADVCTNPKSGAQWPCRSPVGQWTVPAWAFDGPDRRSSSYPIGCKGTQCAPMPYFMLLDAKRRDGSFIGYGIHGRFIRGTNSSHGCIGIPDAFAELINTAYKGSKLTVAIVQPDPIEVFGQLLADAAN